MVEWVDRAGDVVEPTRPTRPTRPSRHALSHGRRPVEVTTDKAPVYPRILDELLPRPATSTPPGDQPEVTVDLRPEKS
ncbi:hypothetical protein FAIPA1_420029 [Frankia sp. AiPs1]